MNLERITKVSDFSKYFGTALNETSEKGIEYYDATLINTSKEKVAFRVRSNGDMFLESGYKISGKEAESYKERIYLGFFVTK